MHGNYQVWTEARIEELIERWAGGDSAGVIGAAMAMSRNAILGKAFRLDLPSRKAARSLEPKPPRRVFVARSLKPASTIRDPDAGRPFVNVSSAITGGYLAPKRKMRTEPEYTKTELRAQLTLAVINTGRAK